MNKVYGSKHEFYAWPKTAPFFTTLPSCLNFREKNCRTDFFAGSYDSRKWQNTRSTIFYESKHRFHEYFWPSLIGRSVHGSSAQLKISQLNYGECSAAKSPGNSRKKFFEPLAKKAFSSKFNFILFFYEIL